jgi:hypothetical protein
LAPARIAAISSGLTLPSSIDFSGTLTETRIVWSLVRNSTKNFSYVPAADSCRARM